MAIKRSTQPALPGAATQDAHQSRPLFDASIMRSAAVDSFRKLDPRHQVRNPVMFVVEVGSLLTTGLFVQAVLGRGEAPASFILAISLWLLFANFAEAMAEGRGKAQAASLRRARRDVTAKRLEQPRAGSAYETVPAPTLRQGDVVWVEAGDIIPSDGEVVEGIASVDESAITGESAPVIRESGGDRNAVTGGTRVLSQSTPATPSWTG
jgi:K+-transporting ATPase ATPase B chain